MLFLGGRICSLYEIPQAILDRDWMAVGISTIAREMFDFANAREYLKRQLQGLALRAPYTLVYPLCDVRPGIPASI